MSERAPRKVAILISGRGSNMAAIASAAANGLLDIDIVGVIADRPDAEGLIIAADRGLPTACIHAKALGGRVPFEAALAQELGARGAELIVLAGFMRILSPEFIALYTGRILNIHPSLLPAYVGLHTHARALKAGEAQHGASVHFVTAELDGGPVILQGKVPVLAGDSEASLAARVLVLEHRLYPQAVAWMAAGRLRMRGTKYEFDGQIQSEPMQLPAP
jgi:phosphoribosylglycinamide formyltransferase-1